MRKESERRTKMERANEREREKGQEPVQKKRYGRNKRIQTDEIKSQGGGGADGKCNERRKEREISE